MPKKEKEKEKTNVYHFLQTNGDKWESSFTLPLYNLWGRGRSYFGCENSTNQNKKETHVRRGENVGGNKREKTLVHIILYLNPKGLAQVNLKRNLEQFSRIVQSILSTVPFEWLKT